MDVAASEVVLVVTFEVVVLAIFWTTEDGAAFEVEVDALVELEVLGVEAAPSKMSFWAPRHDKTFQYYINTTEIKELYVPSRKPHFML